MLRSGNAITFAAKPMIPAIVIAITITTPYKISSIIVLRSFRAIILSLYHAARATNIRQAIANFNDPMPHFRRG